MKERREHDILDEKQRREKAIIDETKRREIAILQEKQRREKVILDEKERRKKATIESQDIEMTVDTMLELEDAEVYEDIEMAADALLELQDIEIYEDVGTQITTCMTEVSCQTGSVETTNIWTQTSQEFNETIGIPYAVPIPNTPLTTYSQPVKVIQNNDEATKFYTGLSSWSVFLFLLEIAGNVSQSKKAKLSSADSLLLTLMRLRLNLRMADLAYRFSIGTSTASTVFSICIDTLFTNLKCLIKWPTKEITRRNLPPIFSDLYPETRCIIDCSEIFIEHPYRYTARAQTYSNYKKHNTVKFLIGILQDKLPITTLTHSDDQAFSFIDKIVTVCAALCNLSV